jgi:hypothetical protein
VSHFSQAQEPAWTLGHPDQETHLHHTDGDQNIYKRRPTFRTKKATVQLTIVFWTPASYPQKHLSFSEDDCTS